MIEVMGNGRTVHGDRGDGKRQKWQWCVVVEVTDKAVCGDRGGDDLMPASKSEEMVNSERGDGDGRSVYGDRGDGELMLADKR